MTNMTITGRFTRDIEVKDVGDHKVIENTVASDEGRDKTTFMDVKIWNRQTEVVEKYLSKGSFVILNGRVEQENWEKEGQKRSKLVLVVNQVTLPPKSENSSEGSESAPAKKKSAKKKGGDDFFEDDDF